MFVMFDTMHWRHTCLKLSGDFANVSYFSSSTVINDTYNWDY